jgi:hypothetical protein
MYRVELKATRIQGDLTYKYMKGAGEKRKGEKKKKGRINIEDGSCFVRYMYKSCAICAPHG